VYGCTSCVNVYGPSQLLLLLLRVADIVFTRNETTNELVNNQASRKTLSDRYSQYYEYTKPECYQLTRSNHTFIFNALQRFHGNFGIIDTACVNVHVLFKYLLLFMRFVKGLRVILVIFYFKLYLSFYASVANNRRREALCGLVVPSVRSSVNCSLAPPCDMIFPYLVGGILVKLDTK